MPKRLNSCGYTQPMTPPTKITAGTVTQTGQPWFTHSMPSSAEARPLTEPTDRSISPTIRMQTMPSEMTPTVEESNSRLTRLTLETNSGLSAVKTLQMTARPTTTGSDPRSPERTRSRKARMAPPTPTVWVTRSSARSIGAGLLTLLLMARRSRLGLRGRAAFSAARHGIIGGAGDGAHQFGIGRVGREHAVVAPEAQHDDAVGHRAHVFHIVADHHHAQALGAHPFDQFEHFGGLRHAESGGRFVEQDSLRIEQHRARDGDGLPLAARQRGDDFAHARDARRKLVEQLPGAFLHGHLVEPQRTQFTAQIDVS